MLRSFVNFAKLRSWLIRSSSVRVSFFRLVFARSWFLRVENRSFAKDLKIPGRRISAVGIDRTVARSLVTDKCIERA